MNTPWERLKQDPSFNIRRTVAIETLTERVQTEISAAEARPEFQDGQIPVRRFVSGIQGNYFKALEEYGKEIYGIAKDVWKSRGQTLSHEFCRNVFRDGITPEIKQHAKVSRGYLMKQFDISTPKEDREGIDNEAARHLGRILARLNMTVEIDATALTPLPDPSVGDIRQALDRGERREAVRLWLDIHGLKGTKRTKASLYRAAKLDKSDYYKWERGKLKSGFSVDKSLRRILTGLQ